MKSVFSILLGFMFVVSGNVGWAQTQGAAPVFNTTAPDPDFERKATESKCIGLAVQEGSKDSPEYAAKYKECMKDKLGGSSGTQICTAAYEKWTAAVEKNKNVCLKFMSVGTTEQTCRERINQCKSQMSVGISPSATENPDETNDVDQIYKSVMGIFDASQATKQTVPGEKKKLNAACYQFKNTDVKTAEKERKEEIKKIKKDIEDQNKNITEANKKLAEEQASVKKEQTELAKALKEAARKNATAKREKNQKINEEMAKSSETILRIQKEIVDTKQVADKMKFEHMKTMTAYTEDKINQQCKSAIATAKSCFIKASKGAKFAEKDTCSSFAFSGKGAKGTAELKKKLKQVSEACFEQNNQAASTIKYNYNESVVNANRKIEEKTQQMNAENKVLEDKKTELTAVMKELDTEKADEEQNINQQTANLAEKVQALVKNTNETKTNAEAVIKDLNDQLQKLTAVELSKDLALTGDSSEEQLGLITDEAESALNANEGARRQAAASCKCPPTMDELNKTKIETHEYCAALIPSGADYKAPKAEKAKGKAKEESKK